MIKREEDEEYSFLCPFVLLFNLGPQPMRQSLPKLRENLPCLHSDPLPHKHTEVTSCGNALLGLWIFLKPVL